MIEKTYIRNGKKSYFESDEHLKTVWWLHNAEQLKDKLSDDEIKEINQYIKESNNSNLWEI